MKPNVSWKFLGNIYNTLGHGLMYLNEGCKSSAARAFEEVIDDLEKLRNGQGVFQSFSSLADSEALTPEPEPTIKISEIKRIYEMADRLFEGKPILAQNFVNDMFRKLIRD